MYILGILQQHCTFLAFTKIHMAYPLQWIVKYVVGMLQIRIGTTVHTHQIIRGKCIWDPWRLKESFPTPFCIGWKTAERFPTLCAHCLERKKISIFSLQSGKGEREALPDHKRRKFTCFFFRDVRGGIPYHAHIGEFQNASKSLWCKHWRVNAGFPTWKAGEKEKIYILLLVLASEILEGFPNVFNTCPKMKHSPSFPAWEAVPYACPTQTYVSWVQLFPW